LARFAGILTGGTAAVYLNEPAKIKKDIYSIYSGYMEDIASIYSPSVPSLFPV
jgi:hypothetical protein